MSTWGLHSDPIIIEIEIPGGAALFPSFKGIARKLSDALK